MVFPNPQMAQPIRGRNIKKEKEKIKKKKETETNISLFCFFLCKKESQHQGREGENKGHTPWCKEVRGQEKDKPQKEGREGNVIKAARYSL